MLTLSDNSATDVLIRLMGGTAPVRERLHTLGVDGITVSRTVQELGAEWIGFPLPPWQERNLAALRQLMASVKPAAHDSANKLFYASRKDHGTPRGMALLLTKIARREALTPAGTDILLEIMQRVAGDLPVLLSLSASSPYWNGLDTGYASIRTIIWQRWPTAGSI